MGSQKVNDWRHWTPAETFKNAPTPTLLLPPSGLICVGSSTRRNLGKTAMRVSACILIVAITLLILSCGGGGGSTGTTPPSTPPPETPTAGMSTRVTGPISRFGSFIVIVGGVRFDTAAANVFIDDAPGSEADLHVGHIVTVTGTVDDAVGTGIADRIEYEAQLRGPIDSLDLDSSQFTALRQTIRITGDTTFGNGIAEPALSNFAVGDLVEVSGFINAGQAVAATRIERGSADSAYEVHGRIVDLDEAGMRFAIGALTVSYQAARLDNYPGRPFQNDDRVAAECDRTAGTCFDEAGVLLATAIEYEGGVEHDGENVIEIDGLVTRFASSQDFDISDFTVTTRSGTEFAAGSADDIRPNARVRAQGPVDEATGVLVAQRVSVQSAPQIEIEGPVSAVDMDNGTLTILGIEIETTAVTRYDDRSDSRMRWFGIHDISPGDRLEVRAQQSPPRSGPVIATRIERQNQEDKIQLRGYLDAADEAKQRFVVLGVTIETNSSTEFEEAFRDQATVGTLVEIDGVFISDGMILAHDLEVSDRDEYGTYSDDEDDREEDEDDRDDEPARYPDLRVGTPSASDTTPVVGAEFTLLVTVSNVGGGESAATTLRYYRSTDATITTSDTEVGTVAIGALAASGTSSESISLTAPSAAGTYYYGACVDTVRGEADTTNNCSASVQVDVSEPQTPPDLLVGSPSVSDSSPETGRSFTLSATVSNQGMEESAATTLRYYRSTDATISSSDTAVGTDALGVLAASGTSNQSITLTAPSTAGTYYYGACVDAVMDESDTTNNCSASVQVQVASSSISLPPPPPQPDLAVVAFFLASGVHDGAPGRALTFQGRIRNVGNVVSPATTLHFYRSRNRTIATDDTFLGSVAVGTIIASRRIDSETLTLTAPSAPGTYYYGACVDAVTDESDTTNNCSDARPITVDGPPPDLVVGRASVTEIRADRTFWLAATVRNQGAGGSAAATVRYKRSTDATITTSDTTVGTDETSTLIPSAGYGATINLTAPSTPGTYYYGVCVDPVRGESDTTNNCSVSVRVEVDGPPPDLVVLAPSVSAINETYPLDGTFSLMVTVRNQGGGTAAATTVRYYRSTDGTISTSDTQLHTGPVNRLSPSGTYEATELFTAPETPGTYYYGACVDAVPRESDTTNNCSSAASLVVN